MKYSIGQVLFICYKNGRIKPGRVVEELTKKTLSGEDTVYMVEVYDDIKQKLEVLNLDEIAVQKFVTISDACNMLYETALAGISGMYNQLLGDAQNLFDYQESSSQEELTEVPVENENDKASASNVSNINTTDKQTERQTIVLADGTVANVNIKI